MSEYQKEYEKDIDSRRKEVAGILDKQEASSQSINTDAKNSDSGSLIGKGVDDTLGYDKFLIESSNKNKESLVERFGFNEDNRTKVAVLGTISTVSFSSLCVGILFKNMALSMIGFAGAIFLGVILFKNVKNKFKQDKRDLEIEEMKIRNNL